MTKIVCDIFMYSFEACLVYTYANNLFNSYRSKQIRIASVIIISALLFIIYQFGNTLVNTVFMFIFYVLLFYIVFSAKISTALFHTILFISIMALSEIAVINSCSVLFNDFDAMSTDIYAYIFVITTSKLVYASVMLIIKKICTNRLKQAEKDSFYWILFLFPLISAILSFLFFFIAGNLLISNFVRIFISGIFIFLLFADLIIFMIYDRANKNKTELYELKAIKVQQETNEKYFDAIEQSQEAIRQFSHDTKNHLLQIRYLEDIDEIHKYLDDIINDVEKISYVGISRNKMLNLIISKYSAICEKKKIKFTADVKFANLQYIEEVDLSTLLNNLLDNAVEAAEQTENGFIELNIFSKNSRFDGIIIKNSCKTPPKHINKELITSKNDKLLHGLGMSIVKKVLKKYEAVYDWNYFGSKKLFEISIALPKTL